MKTTIQALILTPPPDLLVDLMARYSAAERYAYAHRLRGEATLDLEKVAAAKFGLNSRYAKDAVFAANALIAAQTELVKLREKEWAGKFKQAKVKLAKAKTAQSKAGLTAKVAKRERRWLYWYRHRQAGTHPPVIFGGRKLFYKRCAGKISAAEWKESRSGRLVSRGDKTKGGNLNLRLIPGGPGGALLEVALPNGNRAAPRVQLAVYLPRKVS
ncbi:MAG: IS200/IS605 family accessory protein TnpB-related protein, partial [Symbiobacteriia bacterium]